METIGARIKKCREAAGVKQVELASKLGIRQPTIASYESNRRVPGIDVIEKIADCLGVAKEELFPQIDYEKKLLMEKIETLSPKHIAEVASFIAYLKHRDR